MSETQEKFSWLSGKESAWNMGDSALSPRSERSPGKGMETHSSILAWRIAWTKELVAYSPRGRRVGHDWVTHTTTMPSHSDYLKLRLLSETQSQLSNLYFIWQPYQCIKKQRHYFANKGPYSQSYGVSSSHVWMWEVDPKKDWALKHCFQSVVLEKTLVSPLDCKKLKPVHPKESQPWIFTGRTDMEADTLILWPSDVKGWLIRKGPDAGKDWWQEDKGVTEADRVGRHLWLNGHVFEQTPGDGEGQGSPACWNTWSCKELDMTEQQ